MDVNDGTVDAPTKHMMRRLEQAALGASKQKIERRIILPPVVQPPLVDIVPSPRTLDDAEGATNVYSNHSSGMLGAHNVSPTRRKPINHGYGGQRLTTESLSVFNHQSGRNSKSRNWTRETGAADWQQRAHSEPERTVTGTSHNYAQVDPYYAATDNYRANKYDQPGNANPLPRTYAIPKNMSAMAIGANGLQNRTVDAGNYTNDASDVKAPEGIRDGISGQRRRSIFSVLSEEKSDLQYCNRQLLLGRIENLEKELRQERELRRLTEAMVHREKIESQQVLRERLISIEQERQAEPKVVSASGRWKNQHVNENPVTPRNNKPYHTHRDSIELNDKNQSNVRSDIRDNSMPASHGIVRKDAKTVDINSTIRKLNIELSVSTETINIMRRISARVAGLEPCNPNKLLKNVQSVSRSGGSGVSKTMSIVNRRSPSVQKEFFYLTAISVKLKLSKRYNLEPTSGTPTEDLWTQALRLKLPFTAFHDFLMASQSEIFVLASKRQKDLSGHHGILSFFHA